MHHRLSCIGTQIHRLKKLHIQRQRLDLSAHSGSYTSRRFLGVCRHDRLRAWRLVLLRGLDQVSRFRLSQDTDLCTSMHRASSAVRLSVDAECLPRPEAQTVKSGVNCKSQLGMEQQEEQP